MFCYQCEETLKNTACTNSGVCGKSADVAELQDLLLYNLKGISFWVSENKKNIIKDTADADHFVMDSLFTTVTNLTYSPCLKAGDSGINDRCGQCPSYSAYSKRRCPVS